MSGLLRRAYGHGGTRLQRILVSAPHAELAPAPSWLRLLLLTVWIVIPVLVSRFAIPKSTHQRTVIDMSRLQVEPLPVPERPIKPKPVPPPERPVVPRMKPEPPPPVTRPLEKPVSEPEAAPRPVITRSVQSRPLDVPVPQPRIVHERAPVIPDTGAPVAMPIRKNTVAGVEPGAGGPDVSPRLARSARPLAPSGTTDGHALRVTRERSVPSGTGESGSAAPVVHGVSLASLDICPNDREEEAAVRKVLGVVKSRQSCADSMGEFRFIGTQRISSFNLMIYPANGRRPSNRCEELENAYKCLKTR